MSNSINALEEKVIQIRKDICVTTSKIGYSHLGGGMSMTDVAVALYYDFLNFEPKNPHNPDRDRFVLSKAHCGHVIYNIFVDLGMYKKEELWSEYNKIGGRFGMHPNHQYLDGIEASTGSLGHGLAISLGMALAARMDRKDYWIVCMTGDGEMNEGSVWESVMAAAHYEMGNIIMIVDYNKIQLSGFTSEIMNLDPLDEKLRSFGWEVADIDGHNMKQIVETLRALPAPDSKTRRKPIAIISNTIKGKTLPDIEGTKRCHIGQMNPETLKKTLAAIESTRK